MKVNIIKVNTINAYIIAKECNNIRAYITKDCMIIVKYSIINFSIILFATNQAGIVIFNCMFLSCHVRISN